MVAKKARWSLAGRNLPLHLQLDEVVMLARAQMDIMAEHGPIEAA
jgi:hypothetical protein